MAFSPENIYVETGLEASPESVRALAAAPGACVRSFRDLTALASRLESLAPEEAKRSLVVARRAGGFVKEFPAGEGIRPSGWRYFIPAIGCPADCRYCFLQTYHTAGAPMVFAGPEAMLAEIEAVSRAIGGGYFYGGELCDSLMLDSLSQTVGPLLDLFRRLPDAKLELRTKSDQIAPLLVSPAPQNVVVSWTFSPAGLVDAFEPGTASLDARVEAARRLQDAGFQVGLRFDPIILSEGFLGAYRGLVARLAASLDPSRIESAHLGALRFTPALKARAIERFGRGEPFSGEFVLGTDGKYRYPRPLRTSAYAQIARMLSDWSCSLRIRLCMETPEVERDFQRLLGAL